MVPVSSSFWRISTGFCFKKNREDVYIRASHWHEKEGDLSKAIQYALAGKNKKRVETLLEEHITSVASTGKLGTIYNWLNALPAEIVKSNGYFSAVMGWITYLRGEMNQAKQLLSNAQQFAMPNHSFTHSATPHGLRAKLANGQGAPEQAIADAQKCIDLLEKPGHEGASFFLATAYKLLGNAQQMKGERKLAASTFQEAIRLGRHWHHPLVIAKSTWHLALLLYFQGQRRDAVSLCEQLLKTHSDEGKTPSPLAGFAMIMPVWPTTSCSTFKKTKSISSPCPFSTPLGRRSK